MDSYYYGACDGINGRPQIATVTSLIWGQIILLEIELEIDPLLYLLKVSSATQRVKDPHAHLRRHFELCLTEGRGRGKRMIQTRGALIGKKGPLNPPRTKGLESAEEDVVGE